MLLAGVLGGASSARAAFPGRNGVLAVVPLHGNGLILATAAGAGARRICTDPALCGRPGVPRFAPDGQDIVFDAGGGRPVVVAADGTCMWCLLGAPLSHGHAAWPAFRPSGQEISLTVGGVLVRQPLLAGVPRDLHLAGAEAVWSGTGALAFAHDGAVWVRGPGTATPRRMSTGDSPSFAPDGKRVAFSHRGSIWLMATAPGSRPRRLAAGGAPAFSPDGRRVAFIARGGVVEIIAARGGRPRRVPGLRGRGLDWQPRPAHASASCRPGAGRGLLASTPQAVITTAPASAFAPFRGCLRALNATRPIVSLPAGNGADASLAGLSLSGRYSAFDLALDDHRGSCTNTVATVDLSRGWTGANALYRQDCSGGGRGVDSIAANASGFTVWRAFEQVARAHALLSIACPSAGLCVAVDAQGNAATSSAPAAGPSAWTLKQIAPALNAVSCPSPALCFGIAGGSLSSSTNPASGAWSAPVAVDPAPIEALVCPSSSLCVGADGAGSIITSSNPTGPASAWTSAPIDPGRALTGVSCPAVNLCVAVDGAGQAFLSTAPAGGGPAWAPWNLDPVAGLTGIDCPSTSLCVASDGAGHLLSGDPSSRTPWPATSVAGVAAPLSDPVCASSSLCVARDGAGNVVTWSDPGSPTTSTALTPVSGGVNALACPPTGSDCFAAGPAGAVLVGTPGTPGSGWPAEPVDVPPCGACIAEQLFVRDDRGTQALDAVQPGPGHVLTQVTLSGNLLSWSHGGAPRSDRLR